MIRTLPTYVLILVSQLSYGQNEAWGTATSGGSDGQGVIYRIVNDQYEVVKHFEFDYATSGGIEGGLQRLPDGRLWGAVRARPFPNGALIFSYDPTSNVHVEHVHFTDPVGIGPSGYLEPLSEDILVGTCEFGGVGNAGTVFTYTISSNTLVRSFDLAVLGLSQPTGGLVKHPAGLLYGVAIAGGDHGHGALYRYDPASGTAEIIHHFTASDGTGKAPTLTLGANDVIFGMRIGNIATGGTLFSFDPSSGIFAKRFDLNTPGARLPKGRLLNDANGLLWGISTEHYGAERGRLFRFDPSSDSYSVIHTYFQHLSGPPVTSPVVTATGYILVFAEESTSSVLGDSFMTFNATTGQVATQADPLGTPMALCLAADGKLYGFDTGSKALIRYSGGGVREVVNYFNKALLGRVPSGKLMESGTGQVIGACVSGGFYGKGVIYRLDPFTLSYDTIVSIPSWESYSDFIELVEEEPGQLLTIINHAGGGMLMRLSTSTGEFVPLATFTVGGVGRPSSRFVKSGDTVYGTSTQGGLYGEGCLWRVNLNAPQVDTLYSFGPYPNWDQVYLGGLCEMSDGRILGTLWRNNESNVNESYMYIHDPISGTINIRQPVINNSAAPQFHHGFVTSPSGTLWGTMIRNFAQPASSAIVGYNPVSDMLTPMGTFENLYFAGPVSVDTEERSWAALNPSGLDSPPSMIIRWDPWSNSTDTLHVRTVSAEGTSFLGDILLTSFGVGVEERTARGLGSIYPNPTTGLFTIDLTVTERVRVQVLDIQGRVVLDGKSCLGRCELDVSALPEGCYIAILDANKQGRSAIRLIKETGH